MYKSIFKSILSITICVIIFTACRKDNDQNLPPQPASKDTSSTGFYFLNEGGFGYNNATLDYFDVHNGVYYRDVFTSSNPDATLGLGDTGNDIGVYGGKVYVVVNWSNKVEVLDAETGKKIKTLDAQSSTGFNNCRYVTFANKYAYISSYTNNEKGMVIEVDTATLNVTRTVEVGRQPEELQVVGNKIYVANSGGYSANALEDNVSVIDLSNFRVTNNITVAPNLRRMKKDSDGNLYICPWGPGNKLYIVDTKTDKLADSLNVFLEDLAIYKDTAYTYGIKYPEQTKSYTKVDLKNKKVLSGQFVNDEMKLQLPYGIAIDPNNGNIYIADAKDYVELGDLFCFNSNGKLTQTIEKTGVIPGHIAFYNRKNFSK